MGPDRLRAIIGLVALAVAAALPLLVLLPLGWLWLWQNGYVLYWLGAALVVSLAAFGARAWALRRLDSTLAAPTATPVAGIAAEALSPREAAARAAIERLAADVDPARITEREALTTLGIATVEAVAREMHPDAKDPLWSFTVPEALTLIERVAQRLRPLVVENVPLGDRLTVGQMLALYRWRGVVDMARQAYDVWRIVRLLNPVSAITQELRERLSKAMTEGLREELAKRLLATFVREVGNAAIDLYSGRLAVAAAEPAIAAPAGATVDEAAPLRILLAGQSGAGKSSLVNALAREVAAATDALPATRDFAVYEVQGPGLAAVVLVDSPGIAGAADIEAIAAKAAECDVVVWVAAADRPDRAPDRAALEAIRRRFAATPERPAPPILVALTHIDRLRPFREWSPPYDIATPDGAKARSIREAVEAAAADLARPVGDLVPVAVGAEREPYNVDLVWARLAEALPAARRAQLLRRLSQRRGLDWKRLIGQAVGAGRLAAGVLMAGRGAKDAS